MVFDPAKCDHSEWNDGMPEAERRTCANCMPPSAYCSECGVKIRVPPNYEYPLESVGCARCGAEPGALRMASAEDVAFANTRTGLREIEALERIVDELRAVPLEARPRMLEYLWDRFVDNPTPLDDPKTRPR